MIARKETPSTKERILATAGRLFATQGLAPVSLDDIARDVGLTKKTIYYHFESKDALIASWVRAMSARTFESMESLPPDPKDAIRASFVALGPAMANPGFRGCPFTTTALELNQPDHPSVTAARLHKEKRRAWFFDRLTEAHHPAPKQAAIRLCILWDGALATAVLLRDQPVSEEVLAMVDGIVSETNR